MPLYEVVLQQSFAGQQIINRWNYVMSGTPAAVSGSFALANVLGAIYDSGAVPPNYPPTKLMRKIAAIQTSNVTFDFLSTRNIYSVTDFYEAPFVQALNGSVVAEALSPVLAFGYRTNRVRTDIRRGTKRFVGVNEGVSGSQGALTTSWLTGVGKDVADEMARTLTYDDEGSTITFTPCIVGRERYLPDPTKPERPAYKYYDTESEQMTHLAQGILWDPYPHVRSQTSRQYGRGR